mgnify:CR=1 FL=1
MEKRNVVEERRTPDVERERHDEDWDKQAAAKFNVPAKKVDKSKDRK